jgi:putative resolvase
VAISARVSAAENIGNLDRQAERVAAYCTARGYQVAEVHKEVGAGVDGARPQLLALLSDQMLGLMVRDHKYWLARFGLRCLDTLLTLQGRALAVVNYVENGAEDLLVELTAIVYSCYARLYGQRGAKRKTEVIVRQLEAGEARGETDAVGGTAPA